MSIRQLAVKAWNAISHAEIALGMLSLFPWKSTLTIITGLTPAALAVGSFPAWLIAMLGIIGLCVVAGFLALSLYIREKILGTGILVPRGKKRERADDSGLQQLRKELRECKKNHGEAALRWFAGRVKMNIKRIRDQDPSVKDIRVTVRFAEYKDVDLATEIKTIIEKCTQWPVEIDGSNNPTIMPEKDFKIVFDVGPLDSFSEIAWAFSYGELVNATIGKTINVQRFDDKEHLIVNVLPTVTQ